MRSDANQIAMRVIRRVLDGAKPGELEVGQKRVTYAVSRGEAQPWPEGGVDGIDVNENPQWPAPVIVDCQWDGGHCSLRITANYWRAAGRYRHRVAFEAVVVDSGRTVLWTTVSTGIGDTQDGSTVKIQSAISTYQRKRDDMPDLGQRMNNALRELLVESRLPFITPSYAELCEVEIPSGEVRPAADAVFKRFIHLALMKIEFVDRGKKAAARGTALFDLGRWNINPAQVASLLATEESQPQTLEDEVPPESRPIAHESPLNHIFTDRPVPAKLTRCDEFRVASSGRRRQTNSKLHNRQPA